MSFLRCLTSPGYPLVWVFIAGCLSGGHSSGQIASGESPVVAESLYGPRALSRAFRNAAQKASPSVVTVFAYGQNMPEVGATTSGRSDRRTDNFGGDQGSSDDDTAPQGTGPEATGPAGESDETNEPKPSPLRTADGKPLPVTGLGSGVILTADGRIITNHHVIAGAQRVVVQLPDQTELDAYDVSGDADSDVATMRVRSPEPLVPATLGDSRMLEIGDWVLAIGSPFKLEATVSAGIISAKDRRLNRIRRGRLLQTDAAINPGNSGGPLIDLDGDVIAINTAIATRSGSYQGIGFAIPINQAKWIADELSEHGKVRRSAMGIRLAELTRKIADQLNLPLTPGVLVYQVIGNSAADQAGIKPLDVITHFSGEPVRQTTDLQEVVERQPVGSLQKVSVLRGGQSMELEVRLAPVEDPTQTNPTPRAETDETPTPDQ